MRAINPPLPCYGVDYEADCAICQTCKHIAGCKDLMGDRLKRVAVARAKFSLVPDEFRHRTMKVTEIERDLQSIYVQVYTQVFGTKPVGSLGWNGPELLRLAKEARCSVKMFIFACMFGHYQVRLGPADLFTPSQLTDGRALHRVNTYANACRSKYAAFSVEMMDKLAQTDHLSYDLNWRMLRSEIAAGRWIIQFKLRHEGQPFEPMLEALEDDLDPNWLAIEPRYADTLLAYSKREDDGGHQKTRSAALELFGRIKKHRHEALSNFLAREQAMPEAVETVLAELSFGSDDFEILNEPVTDTIRFWHRLGLSIQHLECVKLLNSGTGIYAGS